MKSLSWHHVHITLSDREAAAKWHDQHTPAKRTQPTRRSENIYCGPNLLQIQSIKVAPESRDAHIESIGIGVLNINEAVTDWRSAGGSIDSLSRHIAKVRDPWGVPFEFIESSQSGYTHINIAVAEPKQLCNWYESNLGGTRVTCDWDNTRFVLAYDTMQIMFISLTPPISSTAERYIDHLGWFTEDLDTIYQRLSAQNVRFPVIPRKYGPVRLAFAEDPCGNWIELLEPPNGNIWSQPK
jgi:catechol 2,3-dioxygenase-like lactoylglutathione lyase family enzyme